MSVWVGRSVADVKQPQPVLPTKNLTLLPASPRPVYRPLCSGAMGRLTALPDRRRDGHQWCFTELNVYDSFLEMLFGKTSLSSAYEKQLQSTRNL